jgi:hypothetical protein
MPEQRSCATVTTRQQRAFVPSQSVFFACQTDILRRELVGQSHNPVHGLAKT